MFKRINASIIAIALTAWSLPANMITISGHETYGEAHDVTGFDDLNKSTEFNNHDTEHAYDPIADLQAQQEYRESVDTLENTVLFSVITPDKNDVVYFDDSNDLCKNYSLHNIEIIYENEKNDCYEVFYKASTNNDIWETVDKLNNDDSVAYAEPDFVWDKTDVGGYDVSGEEFAHSTHFPGLDVEGVWSWLWGNNNQKAPGNGVVVAVIDTGVDYTHVDLKGGMWKNTGEIAGNGIDDDGNGYSDDVYGYDFVENDGNPMDDHGHGTHVAGIIGMQPNNVGGVGLAYGAKIMAIKAGQSTGSFASSDIAKAIKYAADNGADVINMSFGGTGKSYLVEEALKDASHDCVLVAAAGNDGLPTTDAPTPPYFFKEDFYPAGYNYVIGVMATDNDGNFAGFSNWDYIIGANCEYELSAPGVNIYSTLPGDRYASWSGTSMATPNVAAAAAILRSQYTDKNKYTSRFIMGQLVSATNDRCSMGYPLLNIEDSLTNLPKPRIKLTDFYMFDDSSISSNNNGDGIAQPGEVINLGFEAFNYWGKAKDVTISVDALSIADIPNPHVEFITDTVNIGEVGTFATSNNGFSYTDGALTGVTKPVKIRIKEGTPNDVQIKLNFTVTAKNGLDNSDTATYTTSGSYTIIVQNGVAISGVIDHDMTWTADKYWIIQNNVLIPEGVTVTVEPGTQIQFWSADPANPYAATQDVYIQVEGRFIAEGTENKPIEMFPGKGYENRRVIITGNTNHYCEYDKELLDSNYTKSYSLLKYVNIINANQKDYVNDDERGKSFCITEANHCHFTINLHDGYPIRNYFMRNMEFSIIENFGRSTDYYPVYLFALNIDKCLFEKCRGVTVRNYNGYLFGRNLKNSVCANNTNQFNTGLFMYHNHNMYDYDYYYDFNISNSGEGKENGEPNVSNNAFLSQLNTKSPEYIRMISAETGHNRYDISGNYWGTTNPDLVKIQCYDADWNVSLDDLVQEPFLTLDDDMSAIYPFVTEAYITDSYGNRIDTVNGKQNVSLHVKFNRDMAQDIQPQVTYGGSDPYTDYRPNGTWVGAREWRADFTIDPFIEMGRMYIRVKGAAADDDLWLVTGEDTERFFFKITNTGAQAMKLHGSGTSGACDLDWVQDDYDTFAGYNLYRATSYDSSQEISQQSFTKVNSSILSDITFSDTNVEQGKDYFYYFTVIDTAMNESKPSNVVKCTPLDEEKPMITHTPVKAAAVGDQIAIKADVQDNVSVASVKLYYRQAGDGTWKNVNMRNISGSTYTGTISAYEVTEGTLEYYISASDGRNTATSGTAKSPNKIRIDIEHIFDEGSISKNPTCTEAGEMLYTCLDCGQTKTVEIPALGHDYSTEWTIDIEANCQAEGEKSHHCTRCSSRTDITAISKTSHVWNAGNVTRSNTCTEDGIKHFKCINCTAEKDEILEATGHNYVDTVHAATCTERGYTEHICQNCGISYNSDFTALAEHEYEETIVNAATCTTDGVKKLVCKHCGYNKSLAIPATGHHFTDVVIEATQDTLGYTIHTCDKCDYSYIDTFTEYTSEEPIERIPGDVNDDGTVDLVDVILIRRFLAGGWNVTINEDNADVDGDNEVTLADVILIRRYLAGGFDVILK